MKIMTDLKNKVALVTGGNRGIGKSICLSLARRGATVALTFSSHRQEAEGVVALLQENSPGSDSFELHLESAESITGVCRRVFERYGNLDILVNNAAKLEQKKFETISAKDWDDIQNINLRGPFLLSQTILEKMKTRRSGKVINIVSIGGQWGGELAVHYAVSKAGLIGLTRSLAKVYAAHNIQVNAVSPGLVHTEMSSAELKSEAGQKKIQAIPMQRIASSEEISEVVAFLASPNANYITGQTINVNGGMYLG